jgi:hypothetical protein
MKNLMSRKKEKNIEAVSKPFITVVELVETTDLRSCGASIGSTSSPIEAF